MHKKMKEEVYNTLKKAIIEIKNSITIPIKNEWERFKIIRKEREEKEYKKSFE